MITSASLNINEPQVDVTVAGSWNRQSQRLQIDLASLNCATLAVQANNIVLAMPDKGGMDLSGAIKYQGDVARLRNWLGNPAGPPAWQMAGKLQGAAQLSQTAGVIHGDASADVAGLAVVDATGQQFQEPSVHFAARGDYNPQSGVTQIEQLEITSDALARRPVGESRP